MFAFRTFAFRTFVFRTFAFSLRSPEGNDNVPALRWGGVSFDGSEMVNPWSRHLATEVDRCDDGKH